MNYSVDLSYAIAAILGLAASGFVLWLTVWTGKRYVSKEECKMSCNALKEELARVDSEVQTVKLDTQNFVSELHSKVDNRFNELSKEREKQEQRIQQMINDLRSSIDGTMRDVMNKLGELKGGMDAHRDIISKLQK